MRRVLCVWFPEWPMQRLCVARPELKGGPVVLFDESRRGGLEAVHCSRGAIRSGIAPGMPLAEVKSLLREAHFEKWDCEADSAALRKLAGRCQRFSPLVGMGDADSLL